MPDDDHTGVRRATSDADLEAARAVRDRVFVEGQGVPASLEHDGLDGAATHFVAEAGDEIVGTARLRLLDGDDAKVERVAVLPEHRGRGWGRRLMAAAEAHAAAVGASRVVLHAQIDVEVFYRELGYETVSDTFEEAGIPHVEMVKPLEPA